MNDDRVAIGDAWGAALLDHLEGRDGDMLVLELEEGVGVPALDAEWFFRSEPEWEPEERELLAAVTAGPVLDLGAGAGRAALHLQGRGLEVVAVENSPGAAEVCRRRGVRDVRTTDLNDPPTDRAWRAVLLLCGNIGLGGSWEGIRRLLRRLAEISAPGAVLVTDSVNDAGQGEIGLRLRYGDLATPWWRQRNVSAAEAPALVEGTGWRIVRRLHAPNDFDHYLLLERE